MGCSPAMVSSSSWMGSDTRAPGSVGTCTAWVKWSSPMARHRSRDMPVEIERVRLMLETPQLVPLQHREDREQYHLHFTLQAPRCQRALSVFCSPDSFELCSYRFGQRRLGPQWAAMLGVP